jgi:hypothetical protein
MTPHLVRAAPVRQAVCIRAAPSAGRPRRPHKPSGRVPARPPLIGAARVTAVMARRLWRALNAPDLGPMSRIAPNSSEPAGFATLLVPRRGFLRRSRNGFSGSFCASVPAGRPSRDPALPGCDPAGLPGCDPAGTPPAPPAVTPPASPAVTLSGPGPRRPPAVTPAGWRGTPDSRRSFVGSRWHTAPRPSASWPRLIRQTWRRWVSSFNEDGEERERDRRHRCWPS